MNLTDEQREALKYLCQRAKDRDYLEYAVNLGEGNPYMRETWKADYEKNREKTAKAIAQFDI